MSDETRITPFIPTGIDQAEKLAITLAKSSLLPDALRGKPSDVLVTIIAGHELGLSPMQAVRSMHIIKGKPVLSADLMVALVKRQPQCIYFKLVESTNEKATYECERKGEGKTTLSFTIQDAQRARLSGDNWVKYPAAMLRARCSAALARAVFPDLTLGVYDPDEAKDFGGGKDINIHVQRDEREIKSIDEFVEARTEKPALVAEVVVTPVVEAKPEVDNSKPFTRVVEAVKAAGMEIVAESVTDQDLRQLVTVINDAKMEEFVNDVPALIKKSGYANNELVRQTYGRKRDEFRAEGFPL
jgi:hypothetical protein